MDLNLLATCGYALLWLLALLLRGLVVTLAAVACFLVALALVWAWVVVPMIWRSLCP